MTSYLLVRAYTTIMSSLSPESSERKKIYIGTRKSKLALVQTELVRNLLINAHPELDFEVIAMTTTGDNNQTKPLHSFGAKALWTQELEVLLLEEKLDLIVHCLKDMPTQLPMGCKIGAILEREDPRDALVMKAGSPYKSLDDLPPGSIVGTSSVRRSAQIVKHYPHLKFQDVRGNVGTRLSKLDDPQNAYSCLILACAGLLRLSLGDRITAPLSSPTLLYAVGQGALGIEIRDGDSQALSLLKPLIHLPTTLTCLAERSLMRTLEGGCSVPIGVETRWEGSEMKMKAVVVSLDGSASVEFEQAITVGGEDDAEEFGRVVAKGLVQGGAEEILKKINLNRDPVNA